MTTSTDRNQEITKLHELIQDIDYGMFTTVDDDGSLHSYPMSRSGEVNSDATLWFFTYAASHKVTEVEHHPQVNVSFSSPNPMTVRFYLRYSAACERPQQDARAMEAGTSNLVS